MILTRLIAFCQSAKDGLNLGVQQAVWRGIYACINVGKAWWRLSDRFVCSNRDDWACLLWQRLQHGLQDGGVAASKGLPLTLDAVPGALYIPVPLAPLLPRQSRSMALLVRACLSLTLAWLLLQCDRTVSTPACFSLCYNAMLQIMPHTA